jgi:hypothetical protein
VPQCRASDIVLLAHGCFIFRVREFVATSGIPKRRDFKRCELRVTGNCFLPNSPGSYHRDRGFCICDAS